MYLHLLQKPEHKIAFMRLARLLADADGFVARNERSYLQACMEELGGVGRDGRRRLCGYRDMAQVRSG